MFSIIAFVLFVIATILCVVGGVTLVHIVGFIAAGLACLALAGVPFGDYIHRAG